MTGAGKVVDTCKEKINGADIFFMLTDYDAAVANKAWYTFKFGQTPTTTHSEKQYLELKHKYDELKSKYDAITTSKPYARSSDDPIMKMDMNSLEISHPI